MGPPSPVPGKHAFGHLKAIPFNDGARKLLQSAGIQPDGEVLDADVGAFIKAARLEFRDREPKVRTTH